MKRKSEQAVALVVTLIMLALVTMMAVVFLSISRRERASVTVTTDMVTARLMTDAALARAQSEIASRILATANPFDYDLIVSTNFYNPAGFVPNASSSTNVNFDFRRDGQRLSRDSDWIQNIANLQYDARVPVVVPTNQTRLLTNDFRFFLDLNRNGFFEPTGLAPLSVGPNRQTNYGVVIGDPQWIGVLERPDQRHSESNRFVGRYAFVVVPAGKTLDINYVHNMAKEIPGPGDKFNRNQGVGSWEINLAGFLSGLNSNSWPTASILPGAYIFEPRSTFFNRGYAFDDALSVLRYRRTDTVDSARALFGARGVTAFLNDPIDRYSNDDILLDSRVIDNPDRPWPGNLNPIGYYDIQELFDTNKTSAAFVHRLTQPMALGWNVYDRYTFYRLLAQMGTDSRDSASNKLYQADYRQHWTNKLNLNYRNDVPNGQTNFIPWHPDPALLPRERFQEFGYTTADLFEKAADRMIRSSLTSHIFTNNAGFYETNFLLGTVPVRPNVSSTNIQIYHAPVVGASVFQTNREYSATLHRLLQVAANIHEATKPYRPGEPPAVFKPLFATNNSGIYISKWIEVHDAAMVTNVPWRNLEFPGDRAALNPADNVLGVPLIVAARKGYPSFNELSIETAVQVSRKLEVIRVGATTFRTNQMYVVGVSNIFGVEAWNSYTQAFGRNIQILVTNRYSMALSNVVGNTAGRVRLLNGIASANIQTNMWTNHPAPGSFILPVHTNFNFIPDSAYIASQPPFLFDPNSTNYFENRFDPPELYLYITNSLQYVVIDRDVTPHRIIDFVNLDKLVTFMDVSQRLMGDAAAGGGGFRRDSTISERDFWNPQRLGQGVTAPTAGVTNQISVALGNPNVAADVWASDIHNIGDKEKAIQKFREFFRPNSTNIAIQVPFTPTRKLYQRHSWQVNDPLVRFTVQDLADPILTDPLGTNNFMVIRPPNASLPVSNLGRLNDRYRPWGGNPNQSSDPGQFNLAIKDPLVRRSDDWQFPTNKLASIGLLGQVHRGTPWQTVYLKSTVENTNAWLQWSGSYGTHPTNDWRIMDLFTVAPSDNASRGLLSVNQTNLAAWSAVLSGVTVLSNSLAEVSSRSVPQYSRVLIEPNSPQLHYIVDGINLAKQQQTNRTFRTAGDVLAAPELTVASPFLQVNRRQLENGISDAAYERIPQQIMSLLKTDEPRVVIYAFGQSLKPADRSLVTVPGFFNLCTNYQVTGEFAAKAMLRLEDVEPSSVAPQLQRMRAVIENYQVLQQE
jgi:hypothetical protein